ncbi:hypothetical protein [uncultured Gelidibacter sp.]|uniref:hypothetical protein n=1 Tax=uncultured Gelidibacter sp. TaxID=259318 RepID=UPI002613803F|nr:hypothetical protein [uncultured Gelidibacter sp.]
MNTSRIISVLLIIIGGIVAIYAKAGTEQNQYILIGGIVILMIGVYRISKNIPSKNDQESSSDTNENS